jgi:hypothetical protein
MPKTFTFTSAELQWVIETAVEKVVNKLQIKPFLANRNSGRAKFVKIKEFAREFNVTAAAVHKWILERKIYAEKLNGTRIWRIPVEEIEVFKKRSRNTTNKDIFNRSF